MPQIAYACLLFPIRPPKIPLVYNTSPKFAKLTKNTNKSPVHERSYSWPISLHVYRYLSCSLACRCAAKTREKGWKVFGIQFFGECWSGPLAHNTYNMHGAGQPTYQFIGIPPKPCNKSLDHECAGGEFVNYIYRLQGNARDIHFLYCLICHFMVCLMDKSILYVKQLRT